MMDSLYEKTDFSSLVPVYHSDGQLCVTVMDSLYEKILFFHKFPLMDSLYEKIRLFFPRFVCVTVMDSFQNFLSSPHFAYHFHLMEPLME